MAGGRDWCLKETGRRVRHMWFEYFPKRIRLSHQKKHKMERLEFGILNPSSASDLLLGVSFHGEKREDQKSLVLSDGAKITAHIPQVIVLTPLLIIAGNFPPGLLLQLVKKCHIKE